jgi:hypothetical protein
LGDLDELPHPVLGYRLLEPPRSRGAFVSDRSRAPEPCNPANPARFCFFCPLKSMENGDAWKKRMEWNSKTEFRG